MSHDADLTRRTHNSRGSLRFLLQRALLERRFTVSKASTVRAAFGGAAARVEGGRGRAARGSGEGRAAPRQRGAARTHGTWGRETRVARVACVRVLCVARRAEQPQR